ncbi:MAG: ABC transporter permease subunit [Clostridiales bacterium]|nr:MAG: ABC transporter permease subunit [Clostridiales bacterium]
MDEAAKIDGCNFTQIMFKIIFPIIKPVMATVGIISFGLAWNDYLWPMIVTLSNPAQRTLSVGMIALKRRCKRRGVVEFDTGGGDDFCNTNDNSIFDFFNQYFIKRYGGRCCKGIRRNYEKTAIFNFELANCSFGCDVCIR